MSLTKPQDQTVNIPWWLVLIEGIALIILGILFIANPFRSAFIAGWVIGIYWIISGAIQLISLFMDRTAWGWKLFAGIISIAAGLVLVNQTLWGTAVMAANTSSLATLGWTKASPTSWMSTKRSTPAAFFLSLPM